MSSAVVVFCARSVVFGWVVGFSRELVVFCTIVLFSEDIGFCRAVIVTGRAVVLSWAVFVGTVFVLYGVVFFI